MNHISLKSNRAQRPQVSETKRGCSPSDPSELQSPASTPRIRYKRGERAPYETHQVLFKAPIASVGPYDNDVIDINGNGKADRLEFISNGYRRLEVVEPIIHEGVDEYFRPIGMQHLRNLALKNGQRYHTELSNWRAHYETQSRNLDGGLGGFQHHHTSKSLKDIAIGLCPEYLYTEGPSVAIDLKRSEFIVYDPHKAKA